MRAMIVLIMAMSHLFAAFLGVLAGSVVQTSAQQRRDQRIAARVRELTEMSQRVNDWSKGDLSA